LTVGLAAETGEIGVRGRPGDLRDSAGRGALVVVAMLRESLGLTERAAYMLTVVYVEFEKKIKKSFGF
jgi:hypothetical protein